MATDTTTTIELAVEMTCQKCVNETSNVLSKDPSVIDYKISLPKKSVIVESTLPSSELIRLIEEGTGKRAVIMGGSGQNQDDTKSSAAVAMLGGIIGCGGTVQGVIRFMQKKDSGVCVIDGTIDGLTPGPHGLAIHECGDLSQGCESVGGHYNPRNSRHGSPTDEERHVGDLGNIHADGSGRALFKFSDRLVKVEDIIGRSVVVSQDADDFGKGRSTNSIVNGNCGKLLSCGIIARSSGLFENSKRICACDGVKTPFDDALDIILKIFLSRCLFGTKETNHWLGQEDKTNCNMPFTSGK